MKTHKGRSHISRDNKATESSREEKRKKGNREVKWPCLTVDINTIL